LKDDLQNFLSVEYKQSDIRSSIYRPYCKQWVYFNATMTHRRGQMPRMFPQPGVENLVICMTGVGNRIGFSAVMADCLPDLHMADSNGASQNFPLYLYDGATEGDKHAELAFQAQAATKWSTDTNGATRSKTAFSNPSSPHTPPNP